MGLATDYNLGASSQPRTQVHSCVNSIRSRLSNHTARRGGTGCVTKILRHLACKIKRDSQLPSQDSFFICASDSDNKLFSVSPCDACRYLRDLHSTSRRQRTGLGCIAGPLERLYSSQHRYVAAYRGTRECDHPNSLNRGIGARTVEARCWSIGRPADSHAADLDSWKSL